MVNFTYNHLAVPQEPKQNALWRAETARITALKHPAAERVKQDILEQCRKDFWFWATGFAWLHEPRLLDDDTQLQDATTKIPFLPWPHQVPVVNHILNVLGKKDFRLVKSRAQGATWMMVLIAIWLWLFVRGAIINFVSKDMDAADKPGDMNSIGAKVDWLLNQLPLWMVGKKKHDWKRNRGEHTFTRADGETAITFFACTQNVATGGRSLVFFVDEHAKHPRPQDKDAMASMQPVTRCRGSLSTPYGTGGEFATIIHDNTIDQPVLVLSWRDNPTQNRGLYRILKGQPSPVDEERYGPLPPNYLNHEHWTILKERLNERGYDLTNNNTRSVWYDQECLRQGANPVLIAQEYDMNFGAETAQYFSDALINRLLNQATKPLTKGEFYVNTENLSGRWHQNPDGRFHIWGELDAFRKPPIGYYAVGCDVSAGLGGAGGSNSAISVLNRKTGKKILSFASPSVKPYELAEIAIALCHWFVNYRGDPAFLIWENQGPGKEFCQRVERSSFQNYYRRKSSSDAPLHSRHTNKPGYWMQKRSAVLGPYREALLEGEFDNPDHDAIKELKQYQMGTDGEPFHVASKDKSDPAGAGASHGDRVVADALAWLASISFGDQTRLSSRHKRTTVNNVLASQVHKDSFAYRRAVYIESLRKLTNKSSW